MMRVVPARPTVDKSVPERNAAGANLCSGRASERGHVLERNPFMSYQYSEETHIQKNSVPNQPLRIQETFLNHCRREKINVVIQLFDQTIIEGLIIGFDQESIVVSSRGTQQLLYKSSVVCVRPFEELHLIFNDGLRNKRRGIAYPRVTAVPPVNHRH